MFCILNMLFYHPVSEATPDSKITGAYCRGLTRAIYILSIGYLSTAPPQVTMGDRGWTRLRVMYAWRSDRMHVAAWELRITSGSPLCRGLTRAIYILSIEYLSMMCLSGDLNPGSPALQASTLWKEPFERPYLVAIRDLTCVATIQYIMHPRFSSAWYFSPELKFSPASG